MNSLNFGGQNADPEIVRENFNKIARWLTNSDACVLTLQSQSADISSLGANATIRNFTVFMLSDTDACEVIIPNPLIYALNVIEKRDTIFFFKGLSGGSTKTITANSGTIEGSASITIDNDQTICIQSDGTEYKILFDSNGLTSGSGDTNFANNDLLANADRVHDFAGFSATIKNINQFVLQGLIGEDLIPYDEGLGMTFIPSVDGVNDAFSYPDGPTPNTLLISLKVDGVDQDVTFTHTNIAPDGEPPAYAYIAAKQTGTEILMNGYYYVPSKIKFEAESVVPEEKKQFLFLDLDGVVKKSLAFNLDNTQMANGGRIDGLGTAVDPLRFYDYSFAIVEDEAINGVSGTSGNVFNITSNYTIVDITATSPDPDSLNLNIDLGHDPKNGEFIYIFFGRELMDGSTTIGGLTVTSETASVFDTSPVTTATKGLVLVYMFLTGIWYRMNA